MLLLKNWCAVWLPLTKMSCHHVTWPFLRLKIENYELFRDQIQRLQLQLAVPPKNHGYPWAFFLPKNSLGKPWQGFHGKTRFSRCQTQPSKRPDMPALDSEPPKTDMSPKSKGKYSLSNYHFSGDMLGFFWGEYIVLSPRGVIFDWAMIVGTSVTNMFAMIWRVTIDPLNLSTFLETNSYNNIWKVSPPTKKRSQKIVESLVQTFF